MKTLKITTDNKISIIDLDFDHESLREEVELSLTFGLEGKGVDGYATVTAEQQEVAAYVFADTQKTGA